MPKLVTQLTDNQCKHAKPKTKPYSIPDGAGLNLIITPNGKKAWMLRYTIPYTKDRTTWVFIGYPAKSLKSARGMRDKYLSLLADNIDPKEWKREQDANAERQKDNTFKHVATLWMEDKQRKAKANPQTAKDIWNSLENHIFPKLGKRPIGELRPKSVAEVIKPLETKGSLDTELKFFLKTLCTYDSLKDTFDIFWDISDKIDELKSQHETVASSTYKFEENKQSALIQVTQKIQLLTRYQSIIDKTSLPSPDIPETAADLTGNADFDPKLNTLVQRSAESIYNESGRWQVDMYERAIRRVSKELGPKLVISASSVRRRTRSPKKPKPPK